MLGEAGPLLGAGDGAEQLTVTVARDEHGYGMKVSGDNPVYVQSVKEGGAAWRAGLRAGDRIVCVAGVPVARHTHQQVVQLIRASPTTLLTVQQNASRHRTPITAPVPVNMEKQRQLEVSKVHTVRLMLEKEQNYIRDLRNELSKVPDVRKQAQLESAEQRCAKLQCEIDSIMAAQPMDIQLPTAPPATPRLAPRLKNQTPVNSTSFLSGLPRSLSNLTGQSLRNLRQARGNGTKLQQENQPPLVRQNSDESSGKRRHVHNNTVPMVPTTCLDNVTPPPLPPRSTERPKRNPLSPTLSPPLNPLAKPKPCSSASPIHNYHRYYPMHQSMHDSPSKMRRSSHSLDGELDGPQPNSIALQMNYPLVNAPPPPLKTDNRGSVPVLHVRSQSSPEHLDHALQRQAAHAAAVASPAPERDREKEKEWWERGTPPPGTPPPPYAHNTQPCADPQRAIISMEEDDSPASDNSTYSGLFSNLRSVRESKARTAVLLNWLLGERRCACAALLLSVTDGFRAAPAPPATLRRWAYEIHSTFLMPHAVLQLNGVDENMANEIEHVLVNEYEKEEILRNVFRKARQKAKEELTQQLTEFQVKRQVGLGTLYGPEDAVIEKCDVDKAQEQVVVERLMCQRLSAVAAAASPAHAPHATHAPHAPHAPAEAQQALLAALIAASLYLLCRPASVAAAVGGSRASFLQRDKLYKQRVKQLAKQHPQPFVVRGHHLQLLALTAGAHCHRCDLAIWGLAPQAYVCTDCKLRVHRACARAIEEGCCLDGEHHNNRISRFMERIHPNAPNNQDLSEKKSRKASGTGHFLNMERSFRRVEDEQPWDQTLTPASAQERRDESDESLYESADCHSDAVSASDDALPRLGKTPSMSKESLKLAVTDEEVDLIKNKKTHRKTMSLSNPLEIVKSLGDEWFDSSRKDLDNVDKRKSRESLWSEEDRESGNDPSAAVRKNSKKESSSQSNSRKSSTTDPPKARKTSKASSVSALNFLRRKKTPTSSIKSVETVAEVADKNINTDELLSSTKLFLEEEKRVSAIHVSTPVVETDSDEEIPTPKSDHRRRLSRQTSRSKSKVRGKSQSVKVNTLRKSHSGTLKKGKKKSVKVGTPLAGRSRQASLVEQTPLLKKKNGETFKQNSWLFSASRGEPRRENSTEEPPAAAEAEPDAAPDRPPDHDAQHNWRAASAGAAGGPPSGAASGAAGGSSRGVYRAESCRERDAPRRGKHRNASDPNRLTAHNHNDLEPGAATAPSGSSSSSSLSSRSNESNTAPVGDQQASQSDWSEDEEPLAAQWADSLPPQLLDSLLLSPRLRKRQEVMHELIVSEGSHVRWLKVLGAVFLRPLEAQPALLPPDELRALLPNLPAVRERHAKLYAELRAARGADHLVRIRPVADALLNMLGEPGYAPCLSRFCRGQRQALDALRERRRKSKELHQFLCAREQLPLCARLQLRDLLACVWQRLTKYQLLLESILKTCDSETDSAADGESEEDVAMLRRAIDTAKDVLQGVDRAIRTAENEHRLRSIQSKLEVRIGCSGAEWEEPKRLDLTTKVLRLEGELSIRNDSNKKMSVLALMLEDCLVLVQREGERFLLKPIPQPSQPALLSPLVKWEKVLFRPNAAVRNTFFLMNINGVQMHELSAQSNAEYNNWVRHIQELPLVKPELKPHLTPAHPPPLPPSRSVDDDGINVSRNPSDASEKSASAPNVDEAECERDRASLERSSVEREEKRSADREGEGEKRSVEREGEREEAADREDKHKPRRPTVGRISTHGADPAPPLVEARNALTVLEPAARAAHTARRVCTHQERLRRLDTSISRALRAKTLLVSSLLRIPPESYAQLAELAVADTLGHVDVSGELRLTRSSSAEEEGEPPAPPARAPEPDMHQLLLAAQAQANQLTETLTAALTVNEAALVASHALPASPAPHAPNAAHGAHAAHAGRAHCDACRGRHVRRLPSQGSRDGGDAAAPAPAADESAALDAEAALAERALGAEQACEGDAVEALEGCSTAAELAARLVGASCGLQGALARMLGALPALCEERGALRRELSALREQNDALRLRVGAGYLTPDEISFPKECVDQSLQDQPSNGG